MPRAIWKGHISFGLVNIPVSLFSAERRQDIQFHLLDSRNKGRVRYERVNEATGEEVPWNQIVKGYEYDENQYVLLSDDDLKKASPEVTKKIEIEDFVQLEDIDTLYFDKPYILEPGKSGEKGYALLRETLRKTERVGIAQVVIRSRPHLAALLVRQDFLILELLRYDQELRPFAEFEAPSAAELKMSPREIEMAVQLVDAMTTEWDPSRYHDTYREQLLKYIEERVESGSFEPAAEGEDYEEPESDDTMVDLMAYLEKSLEGKGGPKKPAKKKRATPKKGARKKTARKRAKKVAGKRKTA
jgi:DNA end-binding protein Ku